LWLSTGGRPEKVQAAGSGTRSRWSWLTALDTEFPHDVAGELKSGLQVTTISFGNHEFDDVVYDAVGDVLYLHKGEPVPAAKTLATPEGHAVMLDDAGEIIGITIVNAKWLVERDGQITISVPERIETSASELAPALVA
jgi:uncharacterized protein YuzE